MNHLERFRAVMEFQPVDRLPVIEWAGYWNETLARWHGEGISPEMTDAATIRESLGLDPYTQFWLMTRSWTCPKPPSHGAPIINDEDAYEAILPHLYPAWNPDGEEWFAAQLAGADEGQRVVWLSFDGFFWHPRTLFGIENHFYAFYDEPELMHRMNRKQADFILRMLERFCDRFLTPAFMTFGEDMSYNHGPMLSKELFDEFLAPYYRQVIPAFKERGIRVFVDSDGDVGQLIPWLQEVGVEGILPLERQAGVDVAALRGTHPQWRMIGAFDKMVMKHGEAAMRAEFERLLPTMRRGGFIPSVDHQTPPDVSLENYRIYISLLKEYAEKAARTSCPV